MANPVESFLRGFDAVDRLETRRQLRDEREEIMSHSRKMWLRQDEQYARDEITRLQGIDARNFDAHITSIGKEKADEHAAALQRLQEDPTNEQLIKQEKELAKWITNETLVDGRPAGLALVLQEAIRRMGTRDKEAYERIVLAGGVDAASGPLIRNKRDPVTGIAVVPQVGPNGSLAVEVDGVMGPAPLTNNRSADAEDLVSMINLDSVFFSKWLGPEMMNPNSVLNVSKFLQSQLNAAESRQGPLQGTSAAGANAATPPATTAPPTTQQSAATVSDAEFTEEETRNQGPTNAEEQAAQDARNGPVDEPPAPDEFDGPYAPDTPATGPVVTPGQDLVDNVGDSPAQALANLMTGQPADRDTLSTAMQEKFDEYEALKVDFANNVKGAVDDTKEFLGSVFSAITFGAYDSPQELIDDIKNNPDKGDGLLDALANKMSGAGVTLYSPFGRSDSASKLNKDGVPASATSSARDAFKDDDAATGQTVDGAPVPGNQDTLKQQASNLIDASNSPRKKPSLSEVIQTASFVKMGYIDMDQARRFVKTGSYDAPTLRKYEKILEDGVLSWWDVTGDRPPTLQSSGRIGPSALDKQKPVDRLERREDQLGFLETQPYFYGDESGTRRAELLNAIDLSGASINSAANTRDGQALGIRPFDPTNPADLVAATEAAKWQNNFEDPTTLSKFANITSFVPRKLLGFFGANEEAVSKMSPVELLNSWLQPDLDKRDVTIGTTARRHGVTSQEGFNAYASVYGIQYGLYAQSHGIHAEQRVGDIYYMEQQVNAIQRLQRTGDRAAIAQFENSFDYDWKKFPTDKNSIREEVFEEFVKAGNR